MTDTNQFKTVSVKLLMVVMWLMALALAAIVWRLHRVDKKVTQALAQTQELSQRNCVCPSGWEYLRECGGK
jgi:hypothetical protein